MAKWYEGEFYNPNRIPAYNKNPSPIFSIEHRGYEVDGFPSACWIWQRTINPKGYGMASYKCKLQTIHRAMFKMAGGVIPDELELDHLCRQRACGRPDHLEAVTSRINAQRGNQTKLTQAKADEIRLRLAAGDKKGDICEAFGISRSLLHGIQTGLFWADVAVGDSMADLH